MSYSLEPIYATERREWQYEIIDTESGRLVTRTRWRARQVDAEREAEALVAEIAERAAAKGAQG